MAAPIYNPPIPCVLPIPNGLGPGRMLRVQGNLPPGAQRFAINLQCGPNTDPRDDIALHLNFRFVEMCVVRNHMTAMNWGVEDLDGGMPLNRGDNYEVLVLCEPHSMKIALNGAHFADFPHRIPFQRITHVTVDGDTAVNLISFEGAAGGGPQAHGFAAPPPSYAPPAYGGGGGYAPGYQYY
ncbi:hypothetical protein PYW08_012875 [Mythimna loreyi]|uniref:Uncharacterized protein n=1 Tax=Mythimna loreyi TaxID=667449 RepID=A0ACC2Q3U9_9NEOP|nr:hypothetical protein PYW08_012875 [Mythimna loreyi]